MPGEKRGLAPSPPEADRLYRKKSREGARCLSPFFARLVGGE